MFKNRIRISSSKMDGNLRRAQPSNVVVQENARLGLIDKLVERAVTGPIASEKDTFYTTRPLPKVGKLTLDEVLDHVLRSDPAAASSSGINIGLRSIDSHIDLDAIMMRGFEPDEAADGKLVLFITEKQLMQLLKQRAVVVPSINGGGGSVGGPDSMRLKTSVCIRSFLSFKEINSKNLI